MLLATLRAFRAPSRNTCILASRSMSTASQADVVDIINSVLNGPPTAGPRAFPPPKASKTYSSGPPNPVNVTRLRLHCHAGLNNTISTLTKADGSTIAWFSGGSCGFKRGNRKSYEAGYQCAARIFKKIEEISQRDGLVKVDLFFKGFGQGREALKAALLATEGAQIRPLVDSITDRTPIKIGGTRAKKARRV